MREMKDSGIKWIGAIPRDWNTIKIKHCANLKGRIGWQGLNSSEYKDKGSYLITGTDFKNGIISWNTCVRITKERFQEAPEIHIKENDLLITKDGTIGKVALAESAPQQVSLNSGVLLIKLLHENTYYRKFLYYILLSKVFWDWYHSSKTGNSTIQHLYQEKFKEFSYPICDYTRQVAIADYLDCKCGKIDSTIEREKQVIEKLKAYKQSMITEAVTQGLDPNVPMKDSGIEWIGKIPELWEVVKFKSLLLNTKNSMRVGPFGSALKNEDYVENGYVVYNQRIVLDKNYSNCNTFISEEKYNELFSFSIEDNDILITTRGSIGQLYRPNKNAPKGIIHPCIIKFKIDSSKIMYPLLEMIFNNTDFVKNQFVYLSNSTTIEVVYSNTLKNIFLPCIPYKQQRDIVAYLDQKTSQIDTAIAKKEALIEKLGAYKKSLIYECVTGKMEVPHE